MDEASSPTDISSSLSEFIRKERILKELYQENRNCQKPTEIDLNYNDEEIDGILQQMGRLLSPAGEELDNKVYKHVIETENKSIEQILHEAKELINDNTLNVENASICISTDDSSSECPERENDINLADVKRIKNQNNVNGNRDSTSSSDEELQTQFEVKSKLLKTENSRNGYPMKKKCYNSKKDIVSLPKLNTNNVSTKISSNNANKLYEEINYLRDEIVRINRLYKSCKNESENLKKDVNKLEVRRC